MHLGGEEKLFSVSAGQIIQWDKQRPLAVVRKSHPEMEEQLICLIIPNVLSEEEVQEGREVGSQEGEGEAGGGEEKKERFVF